MKRKNTKATKKRDHLSRSELMSILQEARQPEKTDKALKEELARMRADFITYLYEHSEPI